MVTVIPVSREEMALMSKLDRGVKFMRAKENPRFDIAIDKHKKLKKEMLKDILDKKQEVVLLEEAA